MYFAAQNVLDYETCILVYFISHDNDQCSRS